LLSSRTAGGWAQHRSTMLVSCCQGCNGSCKHQRRCHYGTQQGGGMQMLR
jgi:hypothetical protein